MTDAPTEAVPLRTRLAGVRVVRDVVRAAGPEAMPFLQGQLSQDIDALDVGSSAWSLLLDPQGKVVAWLRVLRAGEDELHLDVDQGFGNSVIARLERFKLRTKCELGVESRSAIALRGPGAAAAGGLPAPWPGVEGADLLDGEWPDGVPEAGRDELEAIRIEAGVPAMGRELTERTIPVEAGQWLIELSVSFTKGCYTGQELVARVDSRGGHAPRPVRGLLVDGSRADVAGLDGAVVVHDGKDVGNLTSSAWSATLDRPVALAVVGRATEPGSDVQVRGGAGVELPARLAHLPLVSGPAGPTRA
jgi:folate-binding protein YgfZ